MQPSPPNVFTMHQAHVTFLFVDRKLEAGKNHPASGYFSVFLCHIIGPDAEESAEISYRVTLEAQAEDRTSILRGTP